MRAKDWNEVHKRCGEDLLDIDTRYNARGKLADTMAKRQDVVVDVAIRHFKAKADLHDELVEAINKYGRHHRGCPQELGEDRGECNCGYKAVSDKTKELK